MTSKAQDALGQAIALVEAWRLLEMPACVWKGALVRWLASIDFRIGEQPQITSVRVERDQSVLSLTEAVY